MKREENKRLRVEETQSRKDLIPAQHKQENKMGKNDNDATNEVDLNY